MEESIHWPTEVANHFEEQHDDVDLEVFAIRDYGSRAKNMAGPESDTDALILFDQPAHRTKRLGEYIDTIDPSEQMYGVDIHGWNLQKFGSLLNDSNPQTIEFLNSPKEYYPGGNGPIESELDSLREYVNRNFNPIRLYYHYQSMAESNYNKYILRKLQHTENGDRYRINKEDANGYHISPLDSGNDNTYFIPNGTDKYRETTTDRTVGRYLTVVRAALYARHIRRTKQFPSMDFEHFLKHSVEADINDRASELLIRKRAKGSNAPLPDNSFEDMIEYEINYVPDNEDLNRRGIDRDKVNEFIDRIDGLLFG